MNERSQRLEKALLEMGQFSDAYEQILVWLDKTKVTLDSIDMNPKNLKNIEIELCKFRVLQNDICAHLSRFLKQIIIRFFSVLKRFRKLVDY